MGLCVRLGFVSFLHHSLTTFWRDRVETDDKNDEGLEAFKLFFMCTLQASFVDRVLVGVSSACKLLNLGSRFGSIRLASVTIHSLHMLLFSIVHVFDFPPFSIFRSKTKNSLPMLHRKHSTFSERWSSNSEIFVSALYLPSFIASANAFLDGDASRAPYIARLNTLVFGSTIKNPFLVVITNRVFFTRMRVISQMIRIVIVTS